MASINIGSDDSILLQQSGRDVVKEMRTQQEILVGSREASSVTHDQQVVASLSSR